MIRVYLFLILFLAMMTIVTTCKKPDDVKPCTIVQVEGFWKFHTKHIITSKGTQVLTYPNWYIYFTPTINESYITDLDSVKITRDYWNYEYNSECNLIVTPVWGGPIAEYSLVIDGTNTHLTMTQNINGTYHVWFLDFESVNQPDSLVEVVIDP